MLMETTTQKYTKMYVLLINPTEYFEIGNPLKFKERLTEMCAKRELDLKEDLKALLYRHEFLAEYHTLMSKEKDTVFTGDPNLVTYADNATKLLKEWIENL